MYIREKIVNGGRVFLAVNSQIACKQLNIPVDMKAVTV